jgi:hypothetical protein
MHTGPAHMEAGYTSTLRIWKRRRRYWRGEHLIVTGIVVVVNIVTVVLLLINVVTINCCWLCVCNNPTKISMIYRNNRPRNVTYTAEVTRERSCTFLVKDERIWSLLATDMDKNCLKFTYKFKCNWTTWTSWPGEYVRAVTWCSSQVRSSFNETHHKVACDLLSLMTPIGVSTQNSGWLQCQYISMVRLRCTAFT